MRVAAARRRVRADGGSTAERGSATVLVVGLIGVLVVCLAGVCALLSAVQASHRARAAADMSALAGAGALLDPAGAGAPCPVAMAYAARNGGRTLRCAVDGETVTVEVAVSSGWPGLGDATARARAGPSPQDSRQVDAE
ncbi:Rv3654c family TadE-like protein [Leekyejoonella antrihumi]|uniref:Rv3654c family TadE-like protein n=1 Tax=Leekyejoonella antrihumi TaxID=1660198 RepID=UPI0016472474|nr:Rv3654c family TadE-like protein [Leekyejoonella antrihumi]